MHAASAHLLFARVGRVHFQSGWELRHAQTIGGGKGAAARADGATPLDSSGWKAEEDLNERIGRPRRHLDVVSCLTRNFYKSTTHTQRDQRPLLNQPESSPMDGKQGAREELDGAHRRTNRTLHGARRRNAQGPRKSEARRSILCHAPHSLVMHHTCHSASRTANVHILPGMHGNPSCRASTESAAEAGSVSRPLKPLKPRSSGPSASLGWLAPQSQLPRSGRTWQHPS